MDAPKVQISNTSRELSLTGHDKMSLFDSSLGGFLMDDYQIDVGRPIAEAIRLLFQKLGETKILIDPNDFVDDNGNQLLVPYQIKKNSTDNCYELCKELTNLYRGFELFYDVKGFLVCRKIKNKINDPVVFPFDTTNTENRNLSVSIENSYNFKNIKNSIKVIGQMLTPLVATPSTDYKTENTTSKLIVYFNYPLYDANNQPFKDGTDMKSFFTYTGAQSNYISAIYNISTGYTVTFTFTTGEQGKCLQPVRGKLYNSCTIEYWDDKYEFCATDELKWSLPNYITIDYTNNSIIRFVIKFNKPLHNSSGTKLATNTDVKSYFTYSGSAANFTSATYVTDNYNNEIDMTFSSNISIGDTLDIVQNTIFDSAGFTIDVSKWTYIFNGTEWYQKTTIMTSENQIQVTVENNIEGHQFSIGEIGKKELPITNEKIYTRQQALSLGQYNLWKHSNFSEELSIESAPIYMLDCNNVVYAKNDKIGVDGIYCIKSMTIPLKNSNMQLSLYKIYDENII